MALGDDALREAFFFYTEWVDSVASSGKPIPSSVWNRPLFTYLLTKKQFNQLNNVCQKNGWPRQECPGITFYPHHLQHVLSSRAGDGLNWQLVAEVLSASFCTRSEVALNKGRDQQGVILNSFQAIKLGKQKYFGMAILQVSENDLAPVTAYHASEAKIKAIKK
ncbi:hypothetical protein CBJ37_21395 [Salmonella enterica subsp. enterica serovar Durham]|nr:hypothetical protein [Salmonella enterica subsp. enterica serovar Telelkebir]EEI9693359.1 hypothetical protein [Salmonella enterica subsp. enterica serovar Hillingdon]EEM8331922.1 hypothetical protein [Salmonella enterica subsp. enterica serovar Durham]